ncbi:FtsK/SpoIIIE family DNA translocase [Desulfovirgula thermocuniculi]|uniref:FtsK/SpoIIIE family DNA translocase n=1 Tax=Desulfovirgula thermocuniculi TaxID=348842 RepID=UPI00040AB3A8|nr:DNA translocase FtsK [Desulfovirgula thermocuniculi]
MKARPFLNQQRCELAGVALICLSLLGFLSLANPQVGLVSLVTERILRQAAGEGRYFFPLLLAYWGFRFIRGRGPGKMRHRLLGGSLLFLVALTLLHMLVPLDYAWRAGVAGEGGGLLGAAFYLLLYRSFGLTGTWVVLATLTLMGAILASNFSLKHLAGRAAEAARAYLAQGKLVNFFFTEVEEEGGEHSGQPVIIDRSGQEVAATGESTLKEPDQPPPGQRLHLVSPPAPERQSYQLPPLSLLARPVRPRPAKAARDIAEGVRRLEETLSSFGVRAKVVQVCRGPAITRYEVQPPAGIKVSRIMGLADDLALAMAAPDVRIEAPVPGKSVVGIEVPNQEVSTVYLRELLETPAFQDAPSRLTVALGKDIAGDPMVTDLAKMPHLLIAGATGSGKSVCLNTIIASILFKATPEEVKFIIIDPKMVELTTYNGIPHLVSPVVTDPKKAATALRWAVREMERRYELFAAAGVRDLARYNELGRPRGNLPFIVIIIDELADLMMVAPADVEDAICRLAQMARAAGIHLVVATQRPSVDVITGLIKANIPSRISFAVSSQIDSRTILDAAGAEKLLGKGDMLFFPVGAPKPIRVQGAYLSDREVEALVSYLKKQAAPCYDEKVVEEDLKVPAPEEEPEDELLPRAVEIFMEAGQASISMLQRRLRIGYARAARLMDILEKRGYVGGYEGGKPRPVLITAEQFEQILKKRG